jgi:GxxExxY protein
MKNEEKLLHADLSRNVLGCCFEVVKELGCGFLERVYKNALLIAMKQKGLSVVTEQTYEVIFRQHKIGKYIADLVVENLIIVELKCCKVLLPEHQSQLISYLKASTLPIGLLVNFGHQRLEYRRLRHPDVFAEQVDDDESIPF